MALTFVLKSFEQLAPNELYAYLQLRSAVFVVEQNCIYQDLDDKDQVAYHVFVHHLDQLVACARIVPGGVAYPEISIGRVIVRADYRQKKLGHELMIFCISQIERHFGAQAIVLSAQAHLQEFYKKHNFAPVGATYLEDGIPHIHMIRH